MRRVRFAGLLLAFVCVLGLSACRTGGGGNTAADAYAVIDDSMKEESFEKVEAEAKEFLTQYPDDAKVDDVLFRLGIAQFNQGEFEDAVDTFGRLIEEHPGFERIIEARYRLAESHFKLEAYEDALRVLEDIKPSGLQLAGEERFVEKAKVLKAESLAGLEIYVEAAREYEERLKTLTEPKDRLDTLIRIGDLFALAGSYRKALEYYNQAEAVDPIRYRMDLGPVFLKEGDAAVRLNRPVDAIRSYSKVIDDSDYAHLHDEAHQAVDDFLASYGETSGYKEMVQVTSGGRTGYKVHFGYVKLLEEYENFDQALAELDKLQNIYKVLPSIIDYDKINLYRSRIRSKRDAAEDKFGLLLPLAGRYDQFSNRMLRGAKLALDQFNDRYPQQQMTLKALNSGADPEQAAKAAENLIREERVLAIVGPILPATIKAVADVVDSYHVPTIIPASGAAGLTELTPYLIRNCITNESQLQRLVEYASGTQGHTRFAIAFPDDDFGNEMHDIFTAEVANIGGEMAAEVKYDPEDADYRKIARELSRSDYDALFLPDGPTRVSGIVGQLVFSGSEVGQLLGSNIWNSPDILQRGGEYLSGAIFVDGFFAESNRPETRSFVEAYSETFQEMPDLFAAQTYDSVKLLLKARLTGATTRVGLAEALYQIQDFEGATGRTSVLPKGEVEKDLAVLSIRDGKIVQLD